jgi:hypothetical protein
MPAIRYGAPPATNAEILADLRQYYELMSMGPFAPDQLAGWIPNGGVATGTIGISDPIWLGSTGRVSWQQDQSSVDPLDTQHTLAHEISHNLGRRHTNLPDGCGARDAATDWPYTDSTIQEVGFDVDDGKAIVETMKDLMTYCTPPGTNIWISMHTYNRLLEGNFQPQGSTPRRVSSAGAEFLLVRGRAQADGSEATIESVYVINSEISAEPSNPMGNYCLHTSGGAEIDYCFMLRFQDHRTGEPLDIEDFAVRIPLPPGTDRVALRGGLQEMAVIERSAAAPVVELTEPDELSGEETITWSASDADGDPLQHTLMYSSDGGSTWLPLGVDLTETALSIDTGDLEGSEVLLRILSSDGLNTTQQTVGPVAMQTGQQLIWGNIDCSGATPPGDQPSVTDARKIVLAVVGSPAQQPAGCPALGETVMTGDTERVWGNVDCSGASPPGDQPSVTDARKIVLDVVGSAAAQPQDCPEIGETVTVLVAGQGSPVAAQPSARRLNRFLR